MTQPLKMLPSDKPWYSEGLRFQCTQCGQCCTGAPGYTWVSNEEIFSIAEHLSISVEEFTKRYLRWVNGRFALLEHPRTYDCIFLKNKKCQIYEVRPKQCRTFPWWAQNLKSPEDWEEAAKYCEGINQEAPLHPLSTIQEQLKIQES